MRFLSSSALASAEKFRLAANCSAAETMRPVSFPPRVFAPRGLYRAQAAVSPVCGFGASTVTEPPAFSTAAMADCEAPATAKASLALSSPPQRRRTPCLARRSTPAFTSVSTSTCTAGSRRPASIACCTRPRLTSLKRLRKMLLNPRLGNRRCSGICPPSKPLMATPERAFWPLTPRPDVLPRPEPMPRPSRFLALVAPGRSLISFSRMTLPLSSRLVVDDAHEVSDLGHHAAHLRAVDQRPPLVHLVEAESDQRRALDAGAPDRAPDLLHDDRLPFCCIGHLANTFACRSSRLGFGLGRAVARAVSAA